MDGTIFEHTWFLVFFVIAGFIFWGGVWVRSTLLMVAPVVTGGLIMFGLQVFCEITA